MIEKEFFGFVIECDFCPNYYNYNGEGFNDAIAEVKDRGWKIKKEDNEWIHICPVCVEKGATK